MAVFDNFVGGSYTLNSRNVECQQAINLYPAINDFGTYQKIYFKQTPGLKKIIELKNEFRGGIVDQNDNVFLVDGNEFVSYKDVVNNKGQIERVRRAIGGLQTDTGYVDIKYNGYQICVVDGDNIYVYVYEEDTFLKYSPAGWLGSKIVEVFEGYFVFAKPNSQMFYISEIYDARNIDALDYDLAEDDPDNIVGFTSGSKYLYIFGTQSVQAYTNNGDSKFPLGSSGSFSVGCLSQKTINKINNQIFWLGQEQSGYGFIYSMSAGSLNVQKISNFAVDQFIQKQEDLEEATAFSYQEDGHTFYCINFKNGNTTWCYDLVSQFWHERRRLLSDGTETRSQVETHMVWKRKHIVSDVNKKALFEQSMNYYDNDGESFKKLRRSPHLKVPDLNRIYINNFKLDMEVGNNLELPAEISLRKSNDGGYSWSSYITKKLPKAGRYKEKVQWNRLGSGVDIVLEISTTSNIDLTIMGAYII